MKETLARHLAENREKSLSDSICDLLTEDIISLKRMPATPLNMSQLAEEMGVSITPVREAMIKLQKRGLVSTDYHKQATIVRFDYSDYAKLHEFRMTLEAEAARQAAGIMTEKEHTHLYTLAQKLEQAYYHNKTKENGSKIVVTKEDIDFHSYVIHCSKNPYIIRQYMKIKPKLLFVRQYSTVKNEKTISVPQEHYVLCYALKTRDAVFAAEAFRHHGQASKFEKRQCERPK